MLATIWLSFPRSSGDRVTAGDKHANFNHDKFRRNALVFLADFVPPARTGPGPCTVYHSSIAAGPAAATNCLGGMPGQPEARRNLHLSDRGVRSSCPAAENRALERAHKALRLQRICPFD